jgi:hypothetical protein
MQNPCHGGHDDHEGHSFSPEGPGPKAFGSAMRDACFPKHFWAPVNVVKYNGQTNPSVWLEDYRLACRAGGANDGRFRQGLAGSSAKKSHQQLGRSSRDFHRQLLGRLRVSW